MEWKIKGSLYYILLLFLCNVLCLAAENDPESFNIQVYYIDTSVYWKIYHS